MPYEFQPPPGWPVPPPGWVPDDNWTPDPAWPPAPANWNFWVWTNTDSHARGRVPPPPTAPPVASQVSGDKVSDWDLSLVEMVGFSLLVLATTVLFGGFMFGAAGDFPLVISIGGGAGTLGAAMYFGAKSARAKREG